MNLYGDDGGLGMYAWLAGRGVFLCVLTEAVNIDLIFQKQEFRSCRVEPFLLEIPITLQDTGGKKNGWQMYLLLILAMYSTIQGGEMCWRKSHKYLYFNPISFQNVPNCIEKLHQMHLI